MKKRNVPSAGGVGGEQAYNNTDGVTVIRGSIPIGHISKEQS